MYKVRYNLGRGKNYKTWKIEDVKRKTSINLNPNEVTLILKGCTLKNNKKVANEIKMGANKRVCAWILCDRVLFDAPKKVVGEMITYNPRITPHWVLNGNDVDNKKYETLTTKGNTLWKDI